MKLSKLLSIAAVGAIFAITPYINAQVPAINGGPGIVVAGSQNISKLPKDAQHFLNKHFKNVGIAKCEQYFAKGKYEVELTNGVDLEFDSNGKLREIDAPDYTVLATSVVKDVLPAKSYKHLEQAGMINSIETIEFDKRGRIIEVELNISDPDTYVFDVNGNFIAISD